MKQSLLIIMAMLGMACATGTSMAASKASVPAVSAAGASAGICGGGCSVDGVAAEGFSMERNGRFMAVEMTLDLADLNVSGNRAVVLTPVLVNGVDSLDLPSVGVYGRRRYYYYVRNGESMLTGPDELSFKASKKPNHIAYSKVIPYQDWMNGAQMKLRRREYGCCNTMLAEQVCQLGGYVEAVTVEFCPELVYVTPAAEVNKSRSLEGSAFIDFVVNRTEINPSYRRNATELAKIRATIDSVRNDADVTITSVWLKGYASPESPYAHNRELAIGRTLALKDYIRQLYHFPDSVILTDYEAEDWAGLRRYVEHSDLAGKGGILAIIDSDMDPDAKEYKIRRTYPEDYSFLLQNCYPALRHTDYRIAYTIRSYNDPVEIRRVMHSQPQKLSLNEFYLVAREYEPGSDEFTEVFETAVRMYPSDPTANLNAANAAMRRGDNVAAARYLAKAGDSPEAVYARGALAVRNEDYATARSYLTQASSMGVEQADVTLRQLEEAGH